MMSKLQPKNLFEPAWPLNDVFLEWLLALINCPGENQCVLFLDSFLGGQLPSIAQSLQNWHQDFHVNEPDDTTYQLTANGPLKDWLGNSYCRLTNLPIDALLKDFVQSPMLMLGSVSFLNLSDRILCERLMLIKRRLHQNGAVVFLGNIVSKHRRLRDEVESSNSCLVVDDFFSESNRGRTEAGYEDAFEKAGFEWEVSFKCVPYQVWLLTNAEGKLFNA